MHYVVRLLYAHKHGTYYANKDVIEPRDKIISVPSTDPCGILKFLMTASDAEQLWKRLFDRYDLEYKYIAVVRVSRYYPYPEMSVVAFKELEW